MTIVNQLSQSAIDMVVGQPRVAIGGGLLCMITLTEILTMVLR